MRKLPTHGALNKAGKTADNVKKQTGWKDPVKGTPTRKKVFRISKRGKRFYGVKGRNRKSPRRNNRRRFNQMVNRQRRERDVKTR